MDSTGSGSALLTVSPLPKVQAERASNRPTASNKLKIFFILNFSILAFFISFFPLLFIISNSLLPVKENYGPSCHFNYFQVY